MRAIETSRDDLAAVVEGAQAAFDEGRPVADAVVRGIYAPAAKTTTRSRHPTSNSSASDALEEQLVTYDALLNEIYSRRRDVCRSAEARSAESLRTMQEESPLVVKDLQALQPEAAITEHILARNRHHRVRDRHRYRR